MIEDLRIGITLSGGGVRAASFHLGVLSRLADEKLLEKITMTSTVSGGSLVTGLIYHSNNNHWPSSSDFKSKCIPYVRKCLTERNLQLNAIMRMIAWPVSIFTVGRAVVIARSMRYCWGIRSKLNDISPTPRWNINATAIESGKSWRFIPRNRMGDYILNYVENPDINLTDALCSSAAVPFLIGPYVLKSKNYRWYKYDINQKKVGAQPPYKRIHIWDGGAYDNLGIEPLVKFGNGIQYRQEINFLLVSDAAQALATAERKWYQPMRLIDVTMDQVRSLRARVLWDHFQGNKNKGAYIRIGDLTEEYQNSSVSNNPLRKPALSKTRISELKGYPTTLYKMKKKDFEDLYQHGWEVANTALIVQCPDLFSKSHSLSF